MTAVVFLFLLLTTVVALAVIAGTGAAFDRREHAAGAERPGHRTVEHLTCRILFVERAYPSDELTLDCVALAGDRLEPGLPFAVTVAPNGPSWFADAVEDMVVRWAEENDVVRFELVHDDEGDRIDALDDRSRVRFDLRSVDLA